MWHFLRGPIFFGIIAALVAIALALYSTLTNPNGTVLNVRSFLLISLIAGGSWGLIAWTVAMIVASTKRIFSRYF